MCYKYPGPRCTAHAIKKLTEASKKYAENPSIDNAAILNDAQRIYDSTPGGMKKLESLISEANNDDEKAILVTRLAMGKEMRKNAIEEYKKSTLGEVRVPSINKNVLSSVTYHYDGYVCFICQEDRHASFDDYGDDAYEDDYYSYYDDCEYSYDGLKVTSVDVDSVLSEILDHREYPQELKQFACEIGLDKPESYNISAVRDNPFDSSEETVIVKMNSEKFDALKAWFYQQPYAQDEEGILQFCRDRGVKTKGYSPIEAVKQYARKTSTLSEQTEKLLQKKKYIGSNDMKTRSIRILDDERFAAALPQESNSNISGIVMRTLTGTYLIAGYEEYKALLESRASRGKFVILS